MEFPYKPLKERTPDSQYINRIRHVLEHGELVKTTQQGVGALTCFGTLPPMVFDLSNGVPFLTERSVANFWRKPIGELAAFINGKRHIKDIQAFGCDFWDAYGDGRNPEMGLEPGDLGPGSYGAAFHDFPKPDGTTLNQFEQLVDQIRKNPNARSHRVTPWIPYYTALGPNRKVHVAPCHGWIFVRIINGKLHLRMDQNSADLPVGVPSNLIQYSALMLELCQVTGYLPGNYIHSLADAHIYENQIESMRELVQREPRPFPTLKLDPTVTNLFAFRPEHFTLDEYNPHPAMKIPYSP